MLCVGMRETRCCMASTFRQSVRVHERASMFVSGCMEQEATMLSPHMKKSTATGLVILLTLNHNHYHHRNHRHRHLHHRCRHRRRLHLLFREGPLATVQWRLMVIDKQRSNIARDGPRDDNSKSFRKGMPRSLNPLDSSSGFFITTAQQICSCLCCG